MKMSAFLLDPSFLRQYNGENQKFDLTISNSTLEIQHQYYQWEPTRPYRAIRNFKFKNNIIRRFLCSAEPPIGVFLGSNILKYDR